MQTLSVLILGCVLPVASVQSSQLSDYYIALAPSATPIEAHAAQRIGNVTGLQVRTPSGGKQIAVGYDAAVTLDVHSNLSGLGDEGFVLAKAGSSFLASGGKNSKRGTLYAVYALLEQLGWRFWSASVIDAPHVVEIPNQLNVRTLPAFEYRETNNYGVLGVDAQEWAAGAMRLNGDAFSHASKPGGGITYAKAAGSVHTAFNIVPPDLNQTHPEWFSEHVGQLCWGNASLIEFMTNRVLQILEKEPNANIISVSQNDNGDYCKRPSDQGIIEEEGSPSAPMLRAVNKIAEAVQHRFPAVAVDTLAYLYTRKPPKLTKPRPNVIVRLCSIECDFGHPLTHPVNSAFNRDLVGWGAISKRVYIWDYVVDYANTVMPWPNYAVLVPNILQFHRHGVKGVFEEGSYWSKGGDLEDLKTYVMAKALWDPSVNSSQVIAEFVQGYYGQGAAAVNSYIELFLGSERSTKFYMGESVAVTSPYLDCKTVVEAGTMLEEALNKIDADEKAPRLQQLALTTRYVALLRWDEFRQYAQAKGLKWPFQETKQKLYDLFAHWYRALGLGVDVDKSGALSERGHGLSWLCKAVKVVDPVASCAADEAAANLYV
eukprot:TRINITY_DN31290_c0_g1_i1.p1 TRINITY_DN31290_c0_g1~~TRINITY_DN31290_c0_g1_i1.p1  ORF type:complete len:600 (-),score=105.29 TRINITY_DN31290_c0_g1_i1:11-1810(-)